MDRNSCSPSAVEIVNIDGAAPLLLTCEHASNRIPEGVSLGIESDDLQSHIGYDIGAAAVTRRLAAVLDAPAILSCFSRLVIDCNRPLASPESIPEEVAGIAIPGNRKLSQAIREQRAHLCFRPFHDAIAQLLQRRDPNGKHLLVSVHSFTPSLAGVKRPWEVGILQRRSPTIGIMMVEALRTLGINAIANQPYQIEDETDVTVPCHGEAHGRAAVLIELRQDQIDSPQGIDLWAGHTATSIRAVLDIQLHDP